MIEFGEKSTIEDDESFLNKLSTEEVQQLKQQLFKRRINSIDSKKYAVLPRFYVPIVENDGLEYKLRQEARAILLERKRQELLENDELHEIWRLLDENYTLPLEDGNKLINYANFRKVSTMVPDKAQTLFKASIFGKLLGDDRHGRVTILTLFNYLVRKTWLRQSRLTLALYDVNGNGILTENDLECYITELILTFPQLSNPEESFHSIYKCTVLRKFLFFLDSKNLKKIRIVDILASGFLDDLTELRECQKNADISKEFSGNFDDNWFSLESVQIVYGQYLNLDRNRDGMLSQDELKQYGSGMLTDVFIERLFQEITTYQGKMDYKGYLDFVLAIENKKDRSSLEYFFRILDVRHVGHLDSFAINFFFRDIQKSMQAECSQLVNVEDVIDEIFDMIKPKDPSKITLTDLIHSKQGDTVVSILTDFDGFLKYENREFFLSESEGNSEEVQC